MSRPIKPPEPPLEYLDANDLRYLKADDLYFSVLRNSLGVFESKMTVFRRDKRAKMLEPVLKSLFRKRAANADAPTEVPDSPDIMDVACGEGNLLCTLALDYQLSRCEGLDLSASKLKIAVSNWMSLRTGDVSQTSDKEMAKEIRRFLATCPKNLLFEQDLRLFHRFFESVNEAKAARGQQGRSLEDLPRLDGVVMNLKLQNVFSYQGREQFVVVLCLRLTKWVYLTMGEESLRMLLEKVLGWVAENGVLIINKPAKHSFKQTARVVHKKQHSSMHFGRHQATVTDFIERNGLEEVGAAGEAARHFWVLTRTENKFWRDLTDLAEAPSDPELQK